LLNDALLPDIPDAYTTLTSCELKKVFSVIFDQKMMNEMGREN